TTGDLRLFSLLAAEHNVCITIDNGSLINVNTNIVQDTRTVTELTNGVWATLGLIGNNATAKIVTTLQEYQLYQEQQYNTYWAYQNQLVSTATSYSATGSQITAYTTAFQDYADGLGLTGQAKTDFVNTGVAAMNGTIVLTASQRTVYVAALQAEAT